ncbi:MAG: ATP-binding protein [Propionibacteriaceae bacterium]|jgi:predicted AAA+ superfamily ATPase|nr:ATP-binding protein [Propionibacteriaceae bacterium]
MLPIAQSPLGSILPRRAAGLVAEALLDTRVVLVNGARQCGKSTLVAQLADQSGRAWYSLDRTTDLQAARRDPTGFVRQSPTMVIDEVQREPELFLAIKEAVDTDPRPGRFLLTGSARVLGLRGLPDALPGRMETIELWPLSQGEIDGRPDGFIDAAFRLGSDLRQDSAESRQGYLGRIVRGGFPEAVARQGKRRRAFHRAYVADLINRDVTQLSDVERGHELRQLLRLVAARSGAPLNQSALASVLGLSRSTVQRHLGLLEEVFLIKRLPAWTRGATGRVVHAPKAAVVDSGVAASLLGQDETSLRRLDSPLGGLLEGFVAMELARQQAVADEPVELFHYRTRDQTEVDLVLAHDQGPVIGLEVKAAETVRADDFRGLRHLANRLGDDFRAGFVLYLGQQSLPFGERLRALPVSAIWET